MKLEGAWDTPAPPLSRRRKDSFDSSLPNTSRASSPGRSSASERGGEEPRTSPIKPEEEVEVDLVKAELADGLTISSSDRILPVANFVCNLALNKNRKTQMTAKKECQGKNSERTLSGKLLGCPYAVEA